MQGNGTWRQREWKRGDREKKMWQRKQGHCLMTQISNWSSNSSLCWLECGNYYLEPLYQSCDRVPGRVGTVQTVVNSTSAWISAAQIVRADTDTLMCCEENNTSLFLPWIESLSVSLWAVILFFCDGLVYTFIFWFHTSSSLLSHIFHISFPWQKRVERWRENGEQKSKGRGEKAFIQAPMLPWQPISQQPMPHSPTMDPHPAICLINMG